jgi:hypothetical protein
MTFEFQDERAMGEGSRQAHHELNRFASAGSESHPLRARHEGLDLLGDQNLAFMFLTITMGSGRRLRNSGNHLGMTVPKNCRTPR